MKRPPITFSLKVILFAFFLIAGSAPVHLAAPAVKQLQQENWPGGPRGSVYDVVVNGHYAYVAFGTLGLGVIDISDPTRAAYVGGISSITGAYRLETAGNRLYVAGRQTGFHIVDITDPLDLKRVGGFDSPSVYVMAASGNHVYAPSGSLGLEVYDVSDPGACRKVGGYDAIHAVDITLSGNRAYVSGSGGLHVIDISNPANCVLLGGYATGGFGGVSQLAASGTFVYAVAGGANGLQIIDTSEPTNCVRVGGYAIEEGPFAWRVKRFDNRLYLEQHSIHLHILDISDPTNCVRIGGISRSGLNDGVAVYGDHAFLGNFYAGLDVLDISNPTNCHRIGQVGFYGDAHDVAAFGRYTMLADARAGLRMLQTGGEHRPTQIGNLTELGIARSVTASGDLAYVAMADGMRVVDASNPTNCLLVGSCPADWVSHKVAVANGYAYVASSKGLQVVDVRIPAACNIVRSGIVTSPANDVQIAGSHLYLAGYQGLHVADIDNSTNVTRVGGWKRNNNNPTYPALAVSGPYVYLASGSDGFNVIHAGTPANCVRIGGYLDATFPVNDVSLLGHYALLLDSVGREVRVFDVSNPSNCVFVTSLKTKGPTKSMNVINGEVFLANGLEGLVVIPSIPDVHTTLRVDATPNVPFTFEAATNLSALNPWTPLLTTNVATMPFDFVDFDVKLSVKPQKFYRVHQP